MSTSQSKIVALALSELYGIVLKEGEPLLESAVVKGIKTTLAHKLPKAAQESQANGWSYSTQGDPNNDYPGDIPSKWADDFLFLFGKALPGKATDLIRDFTSPLITPSVRGKITPEMTALQVGQLVADELVADAADALRRLGASVTEG